MTQFSEVERVSMITNYLIKEYHKTKGIKPTLFGQLSVYDGLSEKEVKTIRWCVGQMINWGKPQEVNG